jgi:aromatic-amino-acid transaminase
MRERIRGMRLAMVEQLTALNCTRDFSFVARQRGMFSYSGLSAAQVERLQSEFAIYAVNTGRICVAALNHNNLNAVTQAIAKVL